MAAFSLEIHAFHAFADVFLINRNSEQLQGVLKSSLILGKLANLEIVMNCLYKRLIRVLNADQGLIL